MKSLTSLPDAYVRPEWKTCPVLGRPWWRMAPPCAESVLGLPDTTLLPTRHDGAQICVLDAGQDYAAAVLDLCTSHDAEYPLPHPGYRLGQAWLWQFEDGEVLECLVQTHENVAALTRGYAPGGHLLLVLDCFLIQDPYRPDLAPWSGSC